MELTPEQKQEVFEHCDWLYRQHERLGGHISGYIQSEFGLTKWQARELFGEWQSARGFGNVFWAYAQSHLDKEQA